MQISLTAKEVHTMMGSGRGVSPREIGSFRRVDFPFVMRVFLTAIISFCALTAVSQSQGIPSVPSNNATTQQQTFSGAERVHDLTNEPRGTGWALLDPSRFRMRQSYSLSFLSGGGESGSFGLYTNNITYQLFKPLTLHVGLGYLHQPFGSTIGAQSGGAGLYNGLFIPSAGLEYRPSKNFLLMVDFRQYPSGTGPSYGRWGYGWTPYSSLFDPWYR